ncbi:hypothetical protein EJ08DRAFT_653157 [Tothia fuscella]|uniref:Uncharacterized protein n=1 Tax=Tothia fuscella TaxID=1048955 RepID=A0A9P4NID2_9PEZI|nr:hypothetical protein EJ08DRAFT_653157 [Tothia fuscella]
MSNLQDNDGDHNMKDNSSSNSPEPTTPPSQSLPPPSELSPPNSRGGPSAPSIPFNANTGSALAGTGSKMPPSTNLNANGKRNWGVKDGRKINGSGNAGNGKGQGQGNHVDRETGYEWSSEQDAPGFAWQSKSGKDEYSRAWSAVAEKDRMIKTRYGDVLHQK